MGTKGTHTWEKLLEYQRCPECSYVFESRTPYELILGKLQKEEQCPRCFHHYTAMKERTLTFGPLIGDPQPIETEWGR
jgi:uncharacterized paraquat-inducible protein A